MTFLEVDPEDRALVLGRCPDVRIVEGAPEGTALVAACRESDIVCCFIYTRFTADVLAQLPQLSLLCTRSVGTDHIDLDACRTRGITVCSVPDYGSHVIAEHVFALLLSALRHVAEGDRKVEGGTFDYHGLRGIALRGKTIGIVGTGKIGRCVARIAHGFGMSILATDPRESPEIKEEFSVSYVPLEELLAASDIITLHVPATEESRHMISAAAFAQMKNGVVLVNTARGSLIDSAALLAALRSGKVEYALLDVLEHEQNFAENRELIAHPHVVTTPHIGFYADDAMRNMYLDAFQSIGEWLQGKTPAHASFPRPA